MSFATSIHSITRPARLLQSPVFEFLIPALQNPIRKASSIAAPSSTSSPLLSHQPSPSSSPPPPRRRRSLTLAQQAFLNSALRVNQAGELAATLIYTAQTPPIIKSHPHLRPLMQHMHAQEAGHLRTFNALVARHRVRPTAMYPVWKVAATALGWATAMMGREAAMACTEAVETEIGGHYNAQVRELLAWMRETEEAGEEVGEEMRGLVETLKTIRDEELEHLDTAVGEDAKRAPGYEVLNRVVRSGCKGAIWISERI